MCFRCFKKLINYFMLKNVKPPIPPIPEITKNGLNRIMLKNVKNGLNRIMLKNGEFES